MFKYPLAVTIGYLNFNEDGGASDGIDEDIEYEFDEILKEIDSYISEQDSIVEAEAKIVKIIETVLDNNWFSYICNYTIFLGGTTIVSLCRELEFCLSQNKWFMQRPQGSVLAVFV